MEPTASYVYTTTHTHISERTRYTQLFLGERSMHTHSHHTYGGLRGGGGRRNRERDGKGSLHCPCVLLEREGVSEMQV